MNDYLGNTPIRQLIPGILLAGILWLGFLVLREFLLTLAWALIIAYVAWPPYRYLRHKLKGKATLSAAVMTAVIAAVILLTVYWLVAMLQDELKTAYQTLVSGFNQESYRLPDFIKRIPWLGSMAQEWLDRLAGDRAGVAAQFADWAQQWTGAFAKFLGGVGHYVMKLGVILVTVFFCFRDGDEAVRQLHQGLVQFLGKYQHVYLRAAGQTVRAVVYGLVLAALGQGMLAGLGYYVAGVKAPVLLGAVTALLAMVPMGATLVWMPLSITLMLTEQPWQGIGLLLWGFLAVSTVDNVIRPLVISGASRVPFLVVLFGVLGGLTAFGPVGLFLGPVILAVLLSVWKAWLKQQKHEQQAPSPVVPQEEPQSNWHALSAEEALSAQDSDQATGLCGNEAQQRLLKYGANTLTPVAGRSAVKRFFIQFHNVLVYVLLVAAGVTAAVEHWIDSGVIVGVVLINAAIGFIQEGKAEKALDAIRDMLTNHAMVRRDNKNFLIPAEQLIPGDIVSIESGDKVPADLRLLQVKNLRVDESMLTGESLPVEKNNAAVDARAALGDRFCLAYSGTLVTYGAALGIVVATGDKTEIGRISSMLRTVPQLTTPLLRQIARFSEWLTFVILTMACATFAYGWYIHHSSLADLFLSAVGFAVAAIPEGLPAIMTITLAIGVQRMAKRNAIIRRLPSVETLGSVTVICSDKTGTLTCNEMTVKSVFVNNTLYDVTGTGYGPHGDIEAAGAAVNIEDHPGLHELAKASVLCNNAALEKKAGDWVIHGDPTEGALITFAHKAKIDPALLSQEMPRTDFIPFESEHRYMASLHHNHSGHGFVFVKGAPERVLGMCGLQRDNGEDRPIDLAHWRRLMNEIAGNGQRLLAVAVKTVPSAQKQIEFADVETGLTLLGIVGMIDPPRPEAVAAVLKCQNAGIRVKMITGDHAVTATAIASQLNIGDGSVLCGEDLDKMTDDELKEAIRYVDVFARTSPENKLRLVIALQADGHIVAMTGDGVNDAPALKRADVGIAMGKKGTEVAKEASKIVLADDNFASIVRAIEEGRGIYDNLKKAIIYVLPNNGGEGLTIAAAIMMGVALPITPVQILWANMITEVTLSLTLAFEPPEQNIMNRMPRNPSEPLLSGFLVWRIVFVSLIMVAGTYGMFLWELSQDASIEAARTVALNTLVMFEIFYVINSRYLLGSVLNWQGLFGNSLTWLAIGLLLIAQMGVTYWSPMQALFGTVDIETYAWTRIIAVGSSVFILVEIEKFFIRLFVSPKLSVGK
ncbi:MAG: HAD-IC family P-type ATPase [Methylobacter sp.]|jgi:magnesium-transporting ATPase (P-type)|nr:HAD-IC family P-type ATPase [Methylobacter sp.]